MISLIRNNLGTESKTAKDSSPKAKLQTAATTTVRQHRSGISAGARGAHVAGPAAGSGSLSGARGWGRPGRCRRDLTGATGCTGLLHRGANGRTAAAFCGCGARAIHGASRGKPRLRPFSLLSSTSQRTRLGALTAAAAAYRKQDRSRQLYRAGLKQKRCALVSSHLHHHTSPASPHCC